MTRTSEEKRLRQFGFMLGGLFLAVAGLSFYKQTQDAVVSLFILSCLGSAVLALIVTLARPKALAPIEKTFIRVGEVMGFITTHIVLGLVFFFILTPLGIFFKIKRSENPFPKIDKASASYWEESQNSPPERFKRQF